MFNAFASPLVNFIVNFTIHCELHPLAPQLKAQHSCVWIISVSLMLMQEQHYATASLNFGKRTSCQHKGLRVSVNMRK